MKSKTCFWFL